MLPAYQSLLLNSYPGGNTNAFSLFLAPACGSDMTHQGTAFGVLREFMCSGREAG